MTTARTRPGRHGVVRNSTGTPEIHSYDEISLYWVGASEFVAALRAAGPGPVCLRINSGGGDAFEGLAMAEAVRQHGNVVAVVDGLAASIASVIAVSASRTIMAESAMSRVIAKIDLQGGVDRSGGVLVMVSTWDDVEAANYLREALGDAFQQVFSLGIQLEPPAIYEVLE